ncbi:hypothetical protein [Pseudogemmobacter humi]|uniref:TnsA endonuclease N-terminal domain-containing protein n=1 Tax=Pseudogemmobacter humi TaxID=2483812 RepID=A0A3P5X5M8_9RHOB|nr:hypothetical protein [Pseudogemmobacter humi]VDC26341.1 hypothetical protein XINFAN_01607 [Pseudogemmobacter humi]
MSEDDDETPWQPPQRSTGTRSFPARSRSSSRGFLLAHLPAEARPRQIIYESNLERQTALLLLARRDLRNLWDQPPKVAFTDKRGQIAHHIFDYLAEFDGGRRVAIAVKPQARAERLGFRETLARIRADLPPHFADEVVLVTEKTLPAAAMHIAELLHMFRACHDPEADGIVGDLMAAQYRPFCIADLVADSGLGGRAFRALVRAIYAGLVRADFDSRITSATVLLPPESR